MEKYKLSYVESLILEGDKQKQKDAKYNEMLEMLKYFVENNMLSAHGDELAEKLIKEATEI